MVSKVIDEDLSPVFIHYETFILPLILLPLSLTGCSLVESMLSKTAGLLEMPIERLKVHEAREKVSIE